MVFVVVVAELMLACKQVAVVEMYYLLVEMYLLLLVD
jgi:hypothetical protein